MKKICLIVLAAVCLLLPAAGMAQGLPDFFQAVQTGLSEGLAVGAAQTAAAMDKDLTLEISAQESRVEEGQTVVVTVTAQNPRPVDAEVSLTLALPERLTLDAGTAERMGSDAFPPLKWMKTEHSSLPSRRLRAI